MKAIEQCKLALKLEPNNQLAASQLSSLTKKLVVPFADRPPVYG